ncbi:MAG: hypothetical protein RR330_04335 [Alistipes sp.]
MKYHLTSLLWILFLSSACTDHRDESAQIPENGAQIEVSITLPATTSRTELEPDGITTRWSSGDQIALWATNGSATPLIAAPFTLWHFEATYPTALFTATIDPMPAGNYTYAAVYPLPATHNGTIVNYDLPAQQAGSADGRYAVMVARPITGSALEAGRNPDFGLHFIHKLHILKITIPAQKNLLGAPVTRLTMTFPAPVAGKITFDVADNTSAPVLSESSNTLTLNFSTPVDAGSTFWAVIAPANMTGGKITFKAYSDTTESEPVTMEGKNFQAAHTTPIQLTIPKAQTAVAQH